MSHVHITLWTCVAHTAGDPSSHGEPAPVKDHSIEPTQAAVCEDVRYDSAYAGQRKARWKSLEWLLGATQRGQLCKQCETIFV